jgi:hypothetical protein
VPDKIIGLEFVAVQRINLQQEKSADFQHRKGGKELRHHPRKRGAKGEFMDYMFPFELLELSDHIVWIHIMDMLPCKVCYCSWCTMQIPFDF